ncbi:ricin-type beta-trefoil lectin domain protein [Streptomyces sp. WMMC500]|uniref:RICIN domain-containing protein n=1 Tax=Streptomyces sp. WMMC500 TaxID=3015154 RepID=UPI00248CD79A|nr:RICIN domain-containing protein [Streptomyces sp. WMMC500]WBB62454.1 ricin-type beta-trefoil lectin domain protein [Streptomyces sp. WMMC500]
MKRRRTTAAAAVLTAAGLTAGGLTLGSPTAQAEVNVSGSQLVSPASNRCLTVAGESTANGAQATVWDCNGKTHQKWTHTSANELRVYSGSTTKCLDIHESGTTPGTRVQTYSCSGNANQKWTLSAGGAFRNPASGLCLDVHGGGNSPNGTPVELWTCRKGATNQFWMPRNGGVLPSGVYFQDTGSIQGWNNHPTDPQKQGVIRNVGSPAYKGGNAIEAQQTYVNEGGGYHSENVQHHAQVVGQDRYYGQAVHIPSNWRFHNQNVTFQQWSPEEPSGPWELMFIQNDELRYGGSGGFSGSIAKITDLRGSWIRIVTRIKFHATDGALEIWVNGTKRVSRTGIPVLPKTAHSVRWSSGIYCTAWRDQQPAGGTVLSVYHDQARIANSYALAEPANW